MEIIFLFFVSYQQLLHFFIKVHPLSTTGSPTKKHFLMVLLLDLCGISLLTCFMCVNNCGTTKCCCSYEMATIATFMYTKIYSKNYPKISEAEVFRVSSHNCYGLKNYTSLRRR